MPTRLPPALTDRVRRFDAVVDGAFDHIRGNRVADRVFYGASALGEHGMLWLFLAAAGGLRGSRHWRATVRMFAGAGMESVVVKGAVYDKSTIFSELFFDPQGAGAIQVEAVPTAAPTRNGSRAWWKFWG